MKFSLFVFHAYFLVLACAYFLFKSRKWLDEISLFHVNELKHMITCWERINHTSKLTKLVDNSTDRRLLI